MNTDNAPLMESITAVVRRPPATQTILGKRVQVRQLAAVAAGLLLFAPVILVASLLLNATAALVAAAAGAGAGLVALQWRPEGLPVWTYLTGTVVARRGRVELPDGRKVRLYVGLCPVQDPHLGQRFTYARSAVEVDPERVDARGAFRPVSGR